MLLWMAWNRTVADLLFLQDVVRIAHGERAKKRGVGSRSVAHRLNADEHRAFEAAIKKGFATSRGTGYRRERKGSPLVNSWRQYADACSWPAIFVFTGSGSGNPDCVEIDLSTLRCMSLIMTAKQQCNFFAKQFGLERILDNTHEDLRTAHSDSTNAVLHTVLGDANSLADAPRHGDNLNVGDRQNGVYTEEDEFSSPRRSTSSNQQGGLDGSLHAQTGDESKGDETTENEADPETVTDAQRFSGAIWEIHPRAITYESLDRSAAKSFAAALAQDMCISPHKSKKGKAKKAKKKGKLGSDD